MTFDNQDSGHGDTPPPSAPLAGKRKRRRGINYPLIVAAVAAVGLAGGWAIYKFSPHAGLFALTQGSPSKEEARTCLENHDFPCAEADYYAYLKLYPNDLAATAILAITLTQDGQHKEALSYYKRAQALGAATYDFYAGYAVSLDAVGDLDGAIRMNSTALQLVPSLVDVRGSLANELVRKGRTKEALNLLERFDRSLEDRGEPAFFTAQIAQIKQKSAGSGEAASPGADSLAANEEPPAAGAGKLDIPLHASNGALFVPVVVDDALTLNFLVDSGASQVSIPGDVARTLMRMGKITGADYLGQGLAILADGSRVPAKLYRIHSMRVGGHEVRDVTASITSGGGSLLLGQSFLRRFKSWSIDNRRRVLVLEG